MRVWRGGGLVLAATALLGVSQVEGQDRSRPGLRGPDGTAIPERIMGLRDRLELTEGQLAALEELRSEAVELRNRRRAARGELLSRFRAGEMQRAELRSALEELRADAPETADERRERIEGILDESQLETLRELRQRRRAFRRGRASVRGRGGPSMRGRARASVRDRAGPWMRGRAWMRGRDGPRMRGVRPMRPTARHWRHWRGWRGRRGRR